MAQVADGKQKDESHSVSEELDVAAGEQAGLKHSQSLGTLQRSGLRITFQNVEYTVVNSQDRKQKISLLKDVSGYFSPGQMSALMGPSGSGKTTLLDVLAGRKTTGTISGSVLFSGVPPTQTFLRRYTGYVEQFDTLLDTLTVREMLLYTAELKCSHKESRTSKVDRVDDVVEKLNLTRCKDVRIGSVLARGISGGQAKRVNIGIALVTSPRVLFLDEPTSGLDSYTANEVMKVVKDLVSSDITICSTIHSPTPFTFRLFDRMLILLRGEVVYFGDRGEEAIEYFQRHNPMAEAMGEGANEAEWIVDITTQADRQNKGSEMAKIYADSELKRRNEAAIAAHAQQRSVLSEASLKELKTRRATVTPFWWALGVLFKYRTISNYRDPQFLGPRIGDKLIFSLLIMTIYWHVGKDLSAGNVVNIAAICFMWNTLPAFGAAAYVPTIVLERPLFIRERNDGLYRVITYLCAKMVDELLLAFVASIVFSCVVYFPLKLKGLWVVFWLTYLCSLSIGIVLAYLVAALSPTMEIANALLPTYVVILLFFAGFLLRWDDIPRYWRWFSYIDFIRYGFGTLMINQFSGQGVIFNGVPVLKYYSLDTFSRWLFLLYEFLFFIVFFVLAFLALQFKTHQKR